MRGSWKVRLAWAALLLFTAVFAVAIVMRPPQPMPTHIFAPPAADRAATPGTAELVAVTPDGVKVWRVTGPGLVVPYVFAESKTGHLSSR